MKKKLFGVIICCILVLGMTGCGDKKEENNNSNNTSKKAINIISGDGTNIGDEISIGTEHFYVIDSDNDYITALAKYNLDIDSGNAKYKGTGKQDENVKGDYGTMEFSTSNYWNVSGTPSRSTSSSLTGD